MRKIEIELFKYDELSEEAKEKAVKWYLNGSVDSEWWDFIYDDAENVGVKISEFDLDRFNIKLEIDDCEKTARKILEEHGKACETYKIAEHYIREVVPTIEAYKNTDQSDDEYYILEDDVQSFNDEFLNDLGEEYLSMLRKEYEHLTSIEYAIDHIEANEYEFKEDGSTI